MRDAKTALDKFRSKYPGKYDKYSDTELLSALQRKYPNSYNDLAVNKEILPPENILQRAAQAIRPIVGPQMQMAGHGINTAAFGIPGAIGEKVLPESAKEYMKPQGLAEQAGAVAGDIGGFILGGPEQLAAKGVSKFLPQGASFGAQALRGAGKGAAAVGSMSPANIASGSSPEAEALKTAGGGALGGFAESVPNALFKGAFKKNIANEKLQGLLKNIKAAKEGIKKNPNATLDATNLWVKLSDIYDNVADPIKPQLSKMKGWIDHLAKNPTIHGDTLRQMESELGDIAKFGSQSGGFAQFIKPKSKVANEAYQAGRSAASGEYDTLASQYGFPEFATQSKEASEILKKWKDLDPSKAGREYGDRVAAAVLGAGLTKSPIGGIGGYLLEKAAQTPKLREGAYQLLKKPASAAIGETTKKAGLAEIANLGK